MTMKSQTFPQLVYATIVFEGGEMDTRKKLILNVEGTDNSRFKHSISNLDMIETKQDLCEKRLVKIAGIIR